MWHCSELGDFDYWQSSCRSGKRWNPDWKLCGGRPRSSPCQATVVHRGGRIDVSFISLDFAVVDV